MIEAKTSIPLTKQIENLLQTIQRENIETKMMNKLSEALTQLMQKPLELLANKLVRALNNLQFIQMLTEDEQTQVDQMMSRYQLNKGKDESFVNVIKI